MLDDYTRSHLQSLLHEAGVEKRCSACEATVTHVLHEGELICEGEIDGSHGPTTLQDCLYQSLEKCQAILEDNPMNDELPEAMAAIETAIDYVASFFASPLPLQDPAY